MRMNRRNVLAGIGVAVVGGGGALASGAFSQVEANRTVSVNTAGDGSALLAFDVDDSYAGVSDGGDADVVQLDFDDINQDAVTTFDGALTVTNNGNSDVALEASDVPAEITFTAGDGTDLESGSVTIGTTDSSTDNSENIDVEIDLTGDATAPTDTDITFTATESTA